MLSMYSSSDSFISPVHDIGMLILYLLLHIFPMILARIIFFLIIKSFFDRDHSISYRDVLMFDSRVVL